MTKILSIFLLNISCLLTSSLFAAEEDKIQLGSDLLSKKLIIASLEQQHEKLSLRTTIRSDEFEDEKELNQKTSGLKAIKAHFNYNGNNKDVLLVTSFGFSNYSKEFLLTPENAERNPYFTLLITFTTSTWTEKVENTEQIHFINAELLTVKYAAENPLYVCYIKTIGIYPDFPSKGFLKNSISHFIKILKNTSINANSAPPLLIATDAASKASYHIFDKLGFTHVHNLQKPADYKLPAPLKFLERKGISHITGINTQHIPELKEITLTEEG